MADLPEELLAELDILRLPALHLVEGEAMSSSRLGGLPLVPANFEWPVYKGNLLSCLCQIDLSAIPDRSEDSNLPQSGFLTFFYDLKSATWGTDPEDRGSWRVLYFDLPATELVRADRPEGMPEQSVFFEKPIAFKQIDTYPGAATPYIEQFDLDVDQIQAYVELCEGEYEDKPKHHLFGHSDPIQEGMMETDCQLLSHGHPTGSVSPEVMQELGPGESDWFLLLQIDSDEDTAFTWYDMGTLYFYIRDQDLAARNFENVWMILQCY